MELTNFPGFSGFQAGRKNGGEYHGKCPGTGPACHSLAENSDRFIVWPQQGLGQARCRKCGWHGDAIQYLRDFHGLGYQAACGKLGVEPKTKTRASLPGRQITAPTPDRQMPRTLNPSEASIPPTAWVEHAEKFVAHCHEQLMANPEQLAYLAGRGIDRQAAVTYRLGWNPADTCRPRPAWGLSTLTDPRTGKAKPFWIPGGLVIPVYRGGVLQRVRVRRTPEQRQEKLPDLKYYRLYGSGSATMVLGDQARIFVVQEAELDAIAVAAAAGDLVGAISVETLEGNPDVAAAELLRRSLLVLNALDAEDPKHPALQRAIAKWANTYSQTRRWPVPTGKDAGEAFRAGVDLREWILTGLPAPLRPQPAAATQPETTSPPAAPRLTATVVPEVFTGTAADGRQYQVVANREQWDAAIAAGMIVFTRPEIEHLHAACLACGPAGQALMATAALNVKEVFPGAYIQRGGSARG